MTFSDEDQWIRLWSKLTDAELERTLRSYLWVAATTPKSHTKRIQQLVAECHRRGQGDIVERVHASLHLTRSACKS